MHSLITIQGLARVYAIDADNPTGGPMRLELVRKGSSHLPVVSLVVAPYHARALFPSDKYEWLWDAGPNGAVIVPEGGEVILKASLMVPAQVLIDNRTIVHSHPPAPERTGV